MKKNLILTAALGYNFKQVELFIKSLRKFYNDKVIFLIKKMIMSSKINLENIIVKQLKLRRIKKKFSLKDTKYS